MNMDTIHKTNCHLQILAQHGFIQTNQADQV